MRGPSHLRDLVLGMATQLVPHLPLALPSAQVHTIQISCEQNALFLNVHGHPNNTLPNGLKIS